MHLPYDGKKNLSFAGGLLVLLQIMTTIDDTAQTLISLLPTMFAEFFGLIITSFDLRHVHLAPRNSLAQKYRKTHNNSCTMIPHSLL